MGSPFKRKLKSLKDKFFKPKVIPEALFAYYHKIPDSIQVKWQRDGKYIIGTIDTGDSQFMTQAVSAKEFIEMVNDSLFAVYEIPMQYATALQKKKLIPTSEQFKQLNDASVKKSSMDFSKQPAIA